MHDVIRDMCLWIACQVEKEKENYFVRAGSQLTKAPTMIELSQLTEVKRVSLMKNDIQQLIEIPETRSLLTLLLGHNKGLEMIVDGFFQHMKELRVLDLSNTGLTVLPTGIAELFSLHYLDVSATNIAKLPWELTKLKKLKCFNFEYMRKLEEVPRQMFSSIPSLQILRMRECGVDVDRSMVEEFECVEDLKELSLRISDLSGLYHLLKSCKLSSCIRCLEIWQTNFSSSTEEEDMQTENFGESIGGLHKSFGKIFFDNLEKVDICRWTCHFQDLTWLILAPNLTELKVTAVNRLEEIISYRKLGEHENLNVFKRLQVLELDRLPELKSIYLKPLLFPSLNKILIEGCPKLKKLPLKPTSAKGRYLMIEGKKKWWDGLEWEDDATLATFASCFRDTSTSFVAATGNMMIAVVNEMRRRGFYLRS